MFIEQGILAAWACMVVLARELIVSSLRMVASSQGVVIQASMWGKVKTVSQIACILVLLAGFDKMFLWVGPLCTWILALTAIISGIAYVKDNFAVVRDGASKKE